MSSDDLVVIVPEELEQEAAVNALVQPEPVYHTVAVILPLVRVQPVVPGVTVQDPAASSTSRGKGISARQGAWSPRVFQFDITPNFGNSRRFGTRVPTREAVAESDHDFVMTCHRGGPKLKRALHVRLLHQGSEPSQSPDEDDDDHPKKAYHCAEILLWQGSETPRLLPRTWCRRKKSAGQEPISRLF